MKIVGAVAMLGLLTACVSPTPSPSLTPSPITSTTAPSPSPEPAVAVAERIVVSTKTITVVADDETVLAEFGYFQPTIEVVDGLSTYLGDPVDTPFAAHNDSPSATYHDWGGLRLVDTDPPGTAPYDSEHWVRVTGADANGLQVVGPGGVHVGSALDAASGSDGSEYTNPDTGRTFMSYRLDVVVVEVPWADSLVPEHNLAVNIGGYLDTGSVEHIIAPSPNFGA